uniref:HECT domain-containing protein n=1 Tax=Clastoptera arizonana TaxID=38151 RepID=A0A1B6DL92_9HEMI
MFHPGEMQNTCVDKNPIISLNSEMFCWGNTVNGELGLGGIEEHLILTPRELIFKDVSHVKYGKVDTLDPFEIKTVACGEYHTLAINEWGQVFSWGCSSHGQLGLNTETCVQMTPKIIKSLATSFVVQITCGYKHCLALTNNGRLYGWGCNEAGQIGIGSKCTSVPEPTLVKALAAIPLAFIACGSYHSFAVSKSGAVYGWGKNSFGQLGLNNEIDQEFPAQLRTLRTIRVKYIACGEDFSVFLTQDGGVFTCGGGQYGQLGHGSMTNEILPRKVLELMGSTVTQISCGRRHTLALVPSRGRVYAFGLGGAGQLGTRAQLNCATPQIVLGPWCPSSSVTVINTNHNLLDYVVKRIFAGGDQCFVTVTRKSDNILPEDFRIFPNSSQIWTVNCGQLLTCENLKPSDVVDQELLKYLETVLSSPECLNGSFLLQNDGHYGCTSKHHGINISLAQECFNVISRIEHESIRDLICEALMSTIPQLSSSPPDVETLRIYLTLPLYHEFNNVKNYIRLQVPFGAALLSLKPEAARIVGLWYNSMSSEYFERLIFIYKNILIYILKSRGPNADKVNIVFDNNIVTSLELLSCLNKLNLSNRGSDNKGMKVPYDTFYVPDLAEHVDISRDYVRWCFEERPLRGHNKYFCNYPFLFDAAAKTSLLQTDQYLQMHSAMTEATSRTFVLFDRIIFSANGLNEQFIELHVTRENIVQDTLTQLSNYDKRDFKKPLKVTFIGEEAEDAGGVRKEFFMLLLKEILDPKYGMFKSYDETNAIWFSEESFEDEVMFFLIGLLCGLAIYNFTIIDLPFPLALYKKLLNEPISLQDINDLSPTLAKSLNDLLNYDQEDLQDVFCLNFEVTREVFGEVKVHALKPGGENILVTQENKQEFVNLYIDFLLNISVDRHFTAFRLGFFKVCDGRILQLFHAHELMEVVVGNENYDWEVFESNAEYKGGFSSSDPTIRMFWEVFHELPLEEKKKFLLFLTGCDRIPIQGISAIKITIQPTTDDKYLPVAHTCFNLLDLPRYSTKEKLRYKLVQAIQQTQGFSLV